MKITSITFNRPTVTPISTDKYELVEALNICVNYVSGFKRFTVPAKFTTDFGSVPWLFQPLIPKQGDWTVTVAYILHDWNYSEKKISRKESDMLLKDMLKAAGMNAAKVQTVYLAVRAFGGSHYK